MRELLSTIFLGIIAVSIGAVSIELIPLSRQAFSWNRCLKRTGESLSKVKAVQLMDDQGKEVLSVMICNGAVFEPRFKSNTK